MPSRTQVVCLHEGERGRSIDPLFIHKLLKLLDPAWIRPWPGNNAIRTKDCGGRGQLMATFCGELRACLAAGGDTTLMVWADLDDDMTNGDQLKEKFWLTAERAGISREDFGEVVFVSAKDRLENWIDFLLNGTTDESREGPRVPHDRLVAEAAKKLAEKCRANAMTPPNPPSLEWSCRNWRTLVRRMQS
jgi:hypothetical protein